VEALAEGSVAKGNEDWFSRLRIDAQRKTEALRKGYEEVPPCFSPEEVL
jgi:hypothetical protein